MRLFVSIHIATHLASRGEHLKYLHFYTKLHSLILVFVNYCVFQNMTQFVANDVAWQPPLQNYI